MAVFDANMLLYLFEPDTPAPIDPETGLPVANAGARVERLMETLLERGEAAVVPALALSEILVHAGAAGPEYLRVLGDRRRFRVAPFDQRAAVRLAAMERAALDAGDLPAGLDITRARLNFDRQIVAIAWTLRETVVYSDDRDIARLAGPLDMEVVPVWSLPPPPGPPRRSRGHGGRPVDFGE